MQKSRSIQGLILTAALVVSLILFAGMYFAASRAYDSAIRTQAAHLSKTVAEGTFNAMFQIMREGWSRPQLEEFINAVTGTGSADHEVRIFRGELVTERFGAIEQPPFDSAITATFADGASRQMAGREGIRFLYPLNARRQCLECHRNATIGETLGVIEVDQPMAPLIDRARSEALPLLLMIAPLPFLAALGVALFLNRKLKASVGVLQGNIERINRVSDLKALEWSRKEVGFIELDQIMEKVGELVEKLRGVAVDKELLEFEIRLLEKFVITSEVVRDWREYVSRLMVEIEQVISAYTLFSIFKVDDELFDLEIFWVRPPDPKTREQMERAVRRALAQNPNFGHLPEINTHHNLVHADAEPLVLSSGEIELQTKSLIVDTPKIGGIVGIGVHARLLDDEMRLLVVESILSTLLNVVGSVKAIYKYTKDLEYYATRDPLTNLYNQRLFWELLGYEAGRSERHDNSFGLLVIDLDNFKSINDTHGHAFGDRFLERFAREVETALRNGDMLARYGGDEFVIILPEADAEQTYAVAQRVLECGNRLELTAPDGSQVKGTASVGVAVYPTHADDIKDLFLFADNMMYKAKTHGRNCVGFPTDEEVVEIFRSIGEKSLLVANAIEEKRIIPYFQPILDTATGAIHAVEVLSRIQVDAGILGAHEFIEIAEKSGLIHKLDYIVMEKAFSQAQESGYDGLLFLNLSPRALVLGEFIPEVKRLTTRYRIEPARVVFEITERDTVKNFTLLEKFVNDLKLEGFGLAIDDFGSGFSSFHYLKRFPIDYVKIEGDFIVNMVDDPRDRAFVHTMAQLADELGICALAEFVENEAVLECVAEAGIRYAQGFHIGRPDPHLPQLVAAEKV